MALSRRQILIGGLAGGGLVVAYALAPRRFPLPLEPREGEFAFGPWIKLGKDGMVSVAVPQLEMGQGVTTVLAQVAAVELGADWRQVAVEASPPSGAYANLPLAEAWAPLWTPAFASFAEHEDAWLARSFAERNRFDATARGTSLAAYEAPLRLAAGALREVLAKAAAERWGVKPTECTLEGGFVHHAGKHLPFGELVEDAAGIRLPKAPVLRPQPARERPKDFPEGKAAAFARLDGPGKVTGATAFAGDIRLPGMVFAAISHAPVGESVLGKYDEGKLKGLPSNVRLVPNDGWLAAVADTWWAADHALRTLAPHFLAKNRAEIELIEGALDKAVQKAETHRIVTIGDPEGAIGPQPSHAIRYDVSPALHAPLETASCTAHLRDDGKLELWLATQAPEQVRKGVAAALGMRARNVILYPMPAGGSFDARLEHPHAVEAALIAKAVGKPVQLTWSRWQEHLAGLPRTPVAAMLWAKTAEQGGQIVAMRSRIACPPAAQELGHRLFGEKSPRAAMLAAAGSADALAVEGALPPYAIPDMAVDHVPVAIGLPVGQMRGGAHGYTAFFTECFIDELAHIAHREPLSYRMEILGNDLRLANCLQHAAILAEWNGGVDASGQGLACHRIGEGRIAVIVTARREENGVRVDKIAACVDIGRIVNLDIARQQIEGGLIYGLGLAVGCATGFGDGLPFVGRLSGLGLPVLNNSPQIVVEFIDSEEAPADPGELGVAAIAPAVANALFSATGLRFRRLPLIEEAE